MQIARPTWNATLALIGQYYRRTETKPEKWVGDAQMETRIVSFIFDRRDGGGGGEKKSGLIVWLIWMPNTTCLYLFITFTFVYVYKWEADTRPVKFPFFFCFFLFFRQGPGDQSKDLACLVYRPYMGNWKWLTTESKRESNKKEGGGIKTNDTYIRAHITCVNGQSIRKRLFSFLRLSSLPFRLPIRKLFGAVAVE